MFDISNSGIISLTRGDTISVPLFINAGTEIRPVRYVLRENDTVYVGICEPNQPFENAIVRQVYKPDEHGEWHLNNHKDLVIKLSSEETEHLESGLYYYIIKLVTENESNDQCVQTLIQKTKLYIED